MIRRAIAIAGTALAALAVMAPAAHASDPRAATLVGAAEAPYTVTDWEAGNDAIGPLQTQRIFYSSALPASYSGSYCQQLQSANPGVTCVISYKTSSAHTASYVSSIPADENVIFVFHHEPENDTFSGPGTNGQNFVSDFEAESRTIRAAASCTNCNIKVAMVAMGYQYSPGMLGTSCSFVPPNTYVDYYFVDVYEPKPNGTDLPDSPIAGQWKGWLNCVNPGTSAANSAKPRKALGIAEYGLGSDVSDSIRAQTLTADDAYLKATFTNFGLWEYWDEDGAQAPGQCNAEYCDWRIQGYPNSTAEWQAIEARN